MRKQTKLVAVLSAAALLAIGASMTSFAAAGWAQEDGVWVWLDKDGDRVTDTWKKSGANNYYLNEDGEMAVDTVVEDGDNKYYVDATGARVANRWVSVDNEDDEPIGDNDDITTIWYYFGSNGKAYKSKAKTIDGKKYIFDDNGYMLSGWQPYDGSLYYLGGENEGWAATGWQLLEPQEGVAPTDGGEYDEEEWFYFNTSNGKVTVGRKYISGKYYTFDANGVMQYKWVVGTPSDIATPDYTRYKDKEDGSQATGWVYAYPLDDQEEEKDDQFWYYLNSKGEPFNYGGTSGVSVTKRGADGTFKAGGNNVATKVIKSKTYLFDDNGKMLTGVFEVSGSTDEKFTDGIYYFTKGSGSAEGSMVTGRASVTYDDETVNYYFRKNGGQAYVWSIIDGTLYGENGERVDAEDGNTYSVITVTHTIYDKDGKDVGLEIGDEVIVNANGKIKRSAKNLKVGDDKYNVTEYKAEVVTE